MAPLAEHYITWACKFIGTYPPSRSVVYLVTGLPKVIDHTVIPAPSSLLSKFIFELTSKACAWSWIKRRTVLIKLTVKSRCPPGMLHIDSIQTLI